MDSIAGMIEREVLSWAGATAEPHRFGGLEFRVNHHEIGHLHGNRQADLPFPRRTRSELVASGRASPHSLKGTLTSSPIPAGSPTILRVTRTCPPWSSFSA